MFLGEHTVRFKAASNAYFESWSKIQSFVCKDPFNKHNHINKQRVYLCFIISIRLQEGRGFFIDVLLVIHYLKLLPPG